MTWEKILDNYINDLKRELAGLSATEKQEITAEIRSNLLEKWKEQGDETGAGMLNVLEAFGEPSNIAREYTGSIRPKGTESIPSWLAIVLTVIIWPAGIVLAWLSSHWRTRNKLIATLIPPVLVVLVMLAMLLTYTMYSVVPSKVVESEYAPEMQPALEDIEISPGTWVASVLNILMLIVLFSSPLISGIYLAATKVN